MLMTPLGEIEIYIDNIRKDYKKRYIETDIRCKDLDGRYSITIDFTPDGMEHIISCQIKGHTSSLNDSIETGEMLQMKSFYSNNTKLSIGMEGDAVCDYDNSYSENGVQYRILNFTKTNRYVFGIAWIEDYNDENEIQTWFGADPTLYL